MRRTGTLCLALLALFFVVLPVAAQPKVTITGFIDQASSFTNNMSFSDLNLANIHDTDPSLPRLSGTASSRALRQCPGSAPPLVSLPVVVPCLGYGIVTLTIGDGCLKSA